MVEYIFLGVELFVSLIPVGLYFLFKKSSEDDDPVRNLFRGLMFRALVLDCLIGPMFFIFPSKRLIILIVGLVGQMLNFALLKRGKV